MFSVVSSFCCTMFTFISDWGQVKHYRAVQEQASTYLELVCSVCDLSDEAVRVTAAEVQRVKLTVGYSFLFQL